MGSRVLPTLMVVTAFVCDLHAQCFQKPGGLSVALLPAAAVTPAGATAMADLRIKAVTPTSALHVALESSGSLSIESPVLADLPAFRAGEERSLTVLYSVSDSGAGELHATVTGDGIAHGAILYALGGRGEVLHGRSGPLDLQMERLDRDHAAGKLDDARYAAQVLRTAAGGATEVAIEEHESKAPMIHGVIRWTDRAGNTHPVRLAPVLLFARGFSSPIASTATAMDGSYSFPIHFDASFTVQVFAEGPGLEVRSLAGRVHSIVSSPHQIAASAAHAGFSVTLTANNVEDNNTAFSVADAILTGQLAIRQLHGAFLPKIVVNFPSDGTYYSSGWNGRPAQIDLLRPDRFDWDVSLHEFGHHVAQELGFNRSWGGPHWGSNLSEWYGKRWGIALAFNEGWATYYGILAQRVMGTAAYGMQFVGDSYYTDTEDSEWWWGLDLETRTIRIDYRGSTWLYPDSRANGEDWEDAIGRILWDLTDSADDAGDTGVALGAGEMLSTLERNRSATLSETFAAVTAGLPVSAVAQIGSIFSEHGVAPALIAPADGSPAGSEPPTFTWQRNGGGPSFRNNSFVLELYDSTFTRLLLTSGVIAANEFTPPAEQWQALAASGESIHWIVRGSQTDDPLTGPYMSGARTLMRH